jgi:pimeloyl-ACP methyl ester carboxylesterase
LRFIQRHLKQLRIAGRSLGELVSGRLGALGHSDGGMVATRLCQEAPVVDACLNMDGRAAGAPIVTEDGIPAPRRPFLYLTKPFRALTDSELAADGLTRDQATQVQTEARERDRRLLTAARQPTYRATLHEAGHESFSDEPLLLDSTDDRALRLMQSIRHLVLDFFNATLVDSGRRLLTARRTEDLELEVIVGRR